ncbi:MULTISPECIES: hypothetical protein [Burkholderia]|uniref:hypothetical protein n=1 Tax=Burkholderia TaxID=32008 RepID=UPI0016412D09|nr:MULTISPECIES: hypothetical protein [Burkholderia]MBF3842809.1 hypothetical protein [Burkholderia pseudomallei]MCS6424293.1 hypothetical protein [Burkholderia thailandensis]MCS6464054.1 hypothetical protein [Burkholderia thailandensis]MCW0048887.1 hypothetical protein [Burkholderia pseudomallei]
MSRLATNTIALTTQKFSHFGGTMDLWTHIATFLAGLATGWTLKVVISNRSNRSHRATFVSQKGNTAGGDIVGGDKSTRE